MNVRTALRFAWRGKIHPAPEGSVMTGPTITRHPDGGFLLRSEWIAPRGLDEVFRFFSDAQNLQRLTPAWIWFEVLTPSNQLVMRPGLLIDYRLRIHGLPLRWQSEITVWEPGERFVDEQRRGPYRYWRHEHRFVPVEEGVKVIDEVRYDVPGGSLLNALFVKRDLMKIFTYRLQALEKILGPAAPRRSAERAVASLEPIMATAG